MVCHFFRLCFAFFLCTIYLVECHVRFVCPRPASVRSDISFANQSMDYCGVDMSAEFDKQYTEVMPGLFTIRFEETQFHRNSPFRVSLHSLDKDEDYCVLLDHIPHNNHALFSPHCSQQGNNYPLGVCDTSNYFITVNIPDITCNRCYLRLTHILLDVNDKIPCDLNNGTCTGYVSCANIKIRASAGQPARNLSSCSRYEDNLASYWPFRPQDTYKVVLQVEEDQVDPLLTFDAMRRALYVDIPRAGFPVEVDSVQLVLNASVVWNTTVREADKIVDTTMVVWEDMDHEDIEHLKNEHLALRVQCGEDTFEGNISLDERSYPEGRYDQREKAEFTTDGWLSDYRFRGPTAVDLSVVTPAGPCAPIPRHFISFLHLGKSSEFMHGILVASILGDRALITMAMYNIQEEIKAITIKGSQLVGAPDLEIPAPDKNTSIFQVSLDVSKQIPFIGTLQFLKQVEVITVNPEIGLTGTFEEGIYTILREGRDIRGIGAFQFTKGQWLKYEILMTGLQSHMRHVELVGEGVSYNLSHSIWHLDPGYCLVEGLVQDLNTKFLLTLWEGRLGLVGHVNTSRLQGLLTAPGSVYCKEVKDTACFFVDITPGGKPVAHNQETLPPSGKAVFLLEGSKVLQYSIKLRNVKEHVHVLVMDVKNGDDLVFNIKLRPDQTHPNTFTITSHIQVPSNQQKQLSAGKLRLEISLPSTGPTPLVGYLPPLNDHLCTQPKRRIIGDQRGYWSVEAAPFQPMVAMVGDTLEFRYQDNVSLFTFPSKEDYQSCNFTNATPVGPQSGSDVQVSQTYHLESVESVYFASQRDCNDTTPLKLTVNAIPAVPPSVGDSGDSCGLLVFSDWRQQRLDAFSGPHPTSSAIAGLAIGILMAVAFFVWDRRLQQKAETAVPGNRFQRF